MKQLNNFLRLLLISSSIIIQTTKAQPPQKFNYQAAIRNSNNAPLTNTLVSVKISLLKDSASGSVVYSETHTATTNANGIVTLQIGGGTVVSGSFSTINWGNGNYFVKTETDPTGKSNYTVSGTTQLLSVPYALYAGTSTNSIGSSSVTTLNGKSIIVYTSSNAYAFSQNQSGSGNWDVIAFASTPLGAIADSLSAVIYTVTKAYAFSQNQSGTGNWDVISFSGSPIGAVASGKNIVVYTDTKAYAFSQNQSGTGNWDVISFSGTPIGAVASGKNIVVYTDTKAYAFSQNQSGTGNWDVISFSGTPIGIISTH